MLFLGMELSEQYRILAELKSPSGKYGRLFHAEDLVNSEQVLLKVLSGGIGHSADLLRNESLFSFSHNGLPKVTRFEEYEQEIILIRNYLSGISLSEHWKQVKRKYRLPYIVELFDGLLPILKHLEANTIVHGDLRPSNILVDPNSDAPVSVIDFGLGIDHKQSRSKKLFFPLGYAAPELILNQLDLTDTRTDLYALGISFWRLFTGKLPLSHPNPSIFTNLQLTHPLPDDSALPKGLFPILKKMTLKHSFKKAPNQMEASDVRACLREGMNGRYLCPDEVSADLHELLNRKSFYQRISFR